MKPQLLLIIAVLFFSIACKGQNAKVDSLQKVLVTLQKDTVKVNTLIAIAYEFRNNKPDTAIYFGNEALTLATELNYKIGVADANLWIGFAKINALKYLDGLRLSKEALILYDQLLVSEKSTNQSKILKQKGNAFNNIAIAYERQSNYPEALKNNLDALKIRKEIDDKRGVAGSYNNIGLIYWKQGIYEEALKNYFSALKINEETGNKNWEAINLTNIGIISYAQNNFPEALKYYLAAIKINEETGDKKTLSNNYNNIGNIYFKQDNYPEALKNYFSALKYQLETGDKQGIAASYSNIGGIYSTQGNYPEALTNYFTALKMKEEVGDKYGITNICSNIANVYINQTKINEASQYLNRSLILAKEIGSLEHFKIVYLYLAKLDSVQGRNKEEVAHYKLYISYRDSLVNQENTKKTVQMKMQYEYDKNEALTKAEQEKMNGLAKAALDVLNHENEIQKLKVKEQQSQLAQSSLLAIKKENEIQILYQTKEIQSLDLSKQKAELKEQTLITEARNKEVQLLNKDNELNQKEISKQKLIRNTVLGVICTGGVFIFFLIRSVNRRKKTSFEKQVSEVEMTALRSQMNPHFIFNSLHSINNYMMNNDKRNASDYLGKFSKLMRLILENSREQEVPLEKDLLTLELYMELEAMRFENKFSYKIEVADDLDPENTLVPPMILQPFVENSILHGLQHKESDGRILIKIQKENDMLVCVVEDNGVGRQKAMEMKETTATHKGESLGMKITNARIDIINKLKKAKASVNLTDLSEGMRAEVKLPYELAF